MAAIDRSGAAESVTGTLLADKIRTSRVSGQCGHPRAYCLIYHRCSFTLYVMCFHFQWAAVVPTTGARKLGTDFQRQRCLPCRVFELHRLMSRCCSFLALFFARAFIPHICVSEHFAFTDPCGWCWRHRVRAVEESCSCGLSGHCVGAFRWTSRTEICKTQTCKEYCLRECRSNQSTLTTLSCHTLPTASCYRYHPCSPADSYGVSTIGPVVRAPCAVRRAPCRLTWTQSM